MTTNNDNNNSSSFSVFQKKEIRQQSDFPYDIIDGLAGEFTNTYCKRLEVPPEFMYISFLTCLGSLLASSLAITTEIKSQPRLYVVLLGQSAEDHKSTALNKTNEFFKYALKNADPEKAKIYRKNNTCLNVCLGAGSAEGLVKRMRRNNNLLLCYDEFKSFISKAKIKNSTLLQCVNTLFDSNHYENQISKSEIIITNGLLSLLAASTIETYEAAWDKSFTAIGFNNRLFIVPGTSGRRFSVPPKIPKKEKQYLANKLYKLLDFVGEYRELNITKKAFNLYDQWYMNRPISIHSRRLDVYALRFMELLAINKCAETIDENTVNDVIELMDWQFEMRQFHDPIDADNTTAKMEEKIRRALSRKDPVGNYISLTDRKLKQTTNANRTGLWYYGLATKNLKTSNEIVFNSKSGLWSLLLLKKD